MKKLVVAAALLLVLPTCSSGSSHPDAGEAGGSGAGTGGASSGGAAGGNPGTGGAGGHVATGGTGGGQGGSAGSGGPGTGGTVTGGKGGKGGSASGGIGGGGVAGHGGGGATGGYGGGPVPQAECATASDCKLQSDCCVCNALPTSEPDGATCALTCIQSHCAAEQLPQNSVDCVAGRCVAGFNCDASHVTCGLGPMSCPAGQVPNVNVDGTCYVGNCVDATQCKSVTSCAACNATGEACVTNDTRMGEQNHCVTIPSACGSDASCACLGPTTCVGTYRSCSSPSDHAGVSCGCPTC